MICFLFFSHDSAVPTQAQTTQTLDACFSHCGIGFQVMGDPSKTVYFETVPTTTIHWPTPGLQGPKPYRNLLAWWDNAPASRLLEVHRLNITNAHAIQAYSYLSRLQGSIGYEDHHLTHAILASTHRLNILDTAKNPVTWTASETVARAMPPEVKIQAFKLGDTHYKLLVPDSLTIPSVKTALRRWNSNHAGASMNLDPQPLTITKHDPKYVQT